MRQQREVSSRASHGEEEDTTASPLLSTASGSKDESVSWIMTALAFTFPALGGLLFGLDISASAGAIDSLVDSTRSGTLWGPELSAFSRGLVVSGSLIGALLSSICAVAFGDGIGRRRELLLASALYVAGGAAMWSASSYNMLVGARVLYGIGIGFAMHAAPIYISETAPTSIRGTLVSLKEAVIVSGILFGYLLGYVFADQVGAWRTLWGTTTPIGAVFGIGMLLLPNSPRHLLYKGKDEEARIALERLRQIDSNTAEQELQALKAAQEESEAEGSGAAASDASSWQLVRLIQGSNRKALTIGMSLMLFQQITGQPSVLYYAKDIVRQAGFSDSSAASFVSVGLGVVKLATTLFATTSIENFGRRPLLLGGVGSLTASLITLAVLAGENESSRAAYISVAAILVYTGAYQVRCTSLLFLQSLKSIVSTGILL